MTEEKSEKLFVQVPSGFPSFCYCFQCFPPPRPFSRGKDSTPFVPLGPLLQLLTNTKRIVEYSLTSKWPILLLL